VKNVTRRGYPKPGRHGEAYEDGEVAMIYVAQKSRKAKRKLARLLRRTEDTVDFIWGWCAGRNYPPEAANKIEWQVQRVRKILGNAAQGRVAL
jgi:hypothetical protein